MISKRNRNESGIAHILLIVIVVAVVAAVGVFVWKATSKDKGSKASSGSTSANVSAIESQCLTKYHDSDLCKFQAASEATPFDKAAANITVSTTANGTTLSFSIKQDGKGNSSMDMSGTQIVTYNGNTYMKSSGETTWIKYPSGSTPSTTTNPTSDLGFLDSMANIQFTKIGTETCGSASCLKYRFTTTMLPGATAYIWFDKSSHLLREFSTSGGTTGDMDMKIAYQSVSISEPTPSRSLTGQ